MTGRVDKVEDSILGQQKTINEHDKSITEINSKLDNYNGSIEKVEKQINELEKKNENFEKTLTNNLTNQMKALFSTFKTELTDEIKNSLNERPLPRRSMIDYSNSNDIQISNENINTQIPP